MSTDRQRDADLDRLLRATLRRDTRPADGACPEAGMLAALVEGEVASAERAGLEAHIAACGRCRDVLAAMDLDAPGLGAPSDAEGALEAKSWLWRGHLHWLIPVTAATMLVVYVASRPAIAPTRQPRPLPESTQALATQAEKDPLAEARRQVETKAVETSGASAQGTSARPPDRAPGAPTPRAKGDGVAPRRAEPAVSALPPAAGKGEPVRMAAAPAAAPPAPAKGDPSAPAAKPEANIAMSVVAQPEPATKVSMSVAAPPPGGVQPVVLPPVPAAVAPLAGQPEVAGGASRIVAAGAAREGQAAMRGQVLTTAPPSVVEVTAPGGMVAWRVGPRGAIWRTADEGRSWYPQRSGVTAALLAAAAPSITTCWAVGASGTVLLTDNGERWERRPFPEQTDLVGVEARSSHDAIVTTRDGRRFATTDRGATWSLHRQLP